MINYNKCIEAFWFYLFFQSVKSPVWIVINAVLINVSCARLVRWGWRSPSCRQVEQCVSLAMPPCLHVRSIVWLLLKPQPTCGSVLTCMISSLIKDSRRALYSVTANKFQHRNERKVQSPIRFSLLWNFSKAFRAGSWLILSYKTNCIPLNMHVWPTWVIFYSMINFITLFIHRKTSLVLDWPWICTCR